MGIAAPALAQDQTDSAASPPVIAPPPPRTDDAVGPAQLRDFSLSGTVTRRADPQPIASPQTEAQQAETSPPPARAASREAPVVQTARNADLQPPRTSRVPTTASTGPGGFAFPTPTPASNQPASFAPALPSSVTSPVADPIASAESGLVSKWPWLLALLTAAGAALWYFRRNRPGGYALAGAGGDASAFDLSPQPAPPRPIPRASPVPAPAPRAPVPEAAPKPATAPVGIVSTRLRPWLEVEFVPAAALVDNEKAAIQFEVTIYNSGSAPARDVLVEAAMFNAGPDQDQVIGQFFARPSGQGEGVTIPPLQRMSFRSLVSLPRDQLRIFEVEKRSLFVPLVGFNAVYRWSNGQGQTSASFVVGRNTNGEKMGPFRVDQGPRTFRALAAHEHTLRIRK
jgi:hypothetical protein